MERANKLFHLPTEKQYWIRTLGILALLIPFFIPGAIGVLMPRIHQLLVSARRLCMLIVLLMLGIEIWKSRKISPLMWALIGVEVWSIVDMLLQQGMNQFFLDEMLCVMTVCALIEVQGRRHAKELLQAFLLMYEAQILINFATMCLFPDGLYYTEMQGNYNWFLGYKNIFIFYFIPALSLELLNKHTGDRPIRFYGMLAVCVICIIGGNSTTGILCMAAFLLLSVSRVYLLTVCNAVTALIVKLAAFFAIVVFNLQGVFQPVFAMLGKEASFTGRTTIWQAAMERIAQKPWIGYGNPWFDKKAELLNLSTATTAHNFILEVLFRFGIVGMCLMIVFLGMIIYKLYKNRRHPYAAALNLGLLSFYIVMMMEGEFNNIQKFSFLFMAGQVDLLISQLVCEKSAIK